MKELGLFVCNDNHKYVGYYHQNAKEVEILGPLGDEGKETLRKSFTKRAESESKAVEIILRTLKVFKQDQTV